MEWPWQKLTHYLKPIENGYRKATFVGFLRQAKAFSEEFTEPWKTSFPEWNEGCLLKFAQDHTWINSCVYRFI
jgi:hypothetical protein